MDTFIQQMINGLTLGSVYALIALGYTLIYGIIKLLNFAHGDIFMVGSFVSYYLILSFNMNIFVAFLGSSRTKSLINHFEVLLESLL